MPDIKPLKSITVKEVSGVAHLKDADLKREMKKLAETNTELCVIAGEMTGYGEKSSQFGPNIFLTGSFVAKNQRNGEIYRSGKCYLPKDAAESIKAHFNSSGASTGLKFNVVISVVEGKGADGYTYMCEPIKTVEVINREAELLATISQAPSPKLLEKKKA